MLEVSNEFLNEKELCYLLHASEFSSQSIFEAKRMSDSNSTPTNALYKTYHLSRSSDVISIGIVFFNDYAFCKIF